VHVGFVIHGREVCRSRDPDCEACVFADLCPSAFDAPRLRADFI
jgi:endonuclease III